MSRASLLLLLLPACACALRVGASVRAPQQRLAISPVMEAPAAEEVTKRNVRRRIMSEDKYKRGGAPFDKAIHKDVNQKMTEKFKSELTEKLKEDTFRELTSGEGNAAVTFQLAKEYGFCWGVERSIELAWAARDAYPEKKMHITNELIHNPGVNDMLNDMDVAFIEKTDAGKRFDTVEEGDVVILPAFGASLEEMEYLDERDVTVVDTTCPWVSKVWNVVDKHQKAQMTSLIHGKYMHEEAVRARARAIFEATPSAVRCRPPPLLVSRAHPVRASLRLTRARRWRRPRCARRTSWSRTWMRRPSSPATCSTSLAA